MERKVVIVEGPDGSGKTTLCAALQARGFTRVRCVPDVKAMHENRDAHNDLFWWYGERLLNYINAETSLVVDRCYLSEEVYGPVMRNFNRLGKWGGHYLDQLCVQRGVLTVFCLPPWPKVLANWQYKRREKWDPTRRTGDYVDAEVKLDRIYRGYQICFESARTIDMPGLALGYDYTTTTAAQLLAQLEVDNNAYHA